MPDSQEPHEELSDDAATNKFRGLLRKRGVESLTCPACGADAWGGISDVGIPILEPAGETDVQIAGSVRALLAACGKCGFIALFDDEVIRD